MIRPGSMVRIAANVSPGPYALWSHRIGTFEGRLASWFNVGQLGMVITTATIPNENGYQLLILVPEGFGWQRRGLFDEAG